MEAESDTCASDACESPSHRQDGCTEVLPDGSLCPRFDRMCASADSIGSRPGEPRAPEAGSWWVPQLAELSCRGNIDQRNDAEGGSDACGTKSTAAALEQGEVLDFAPPPPTEHTAPQQVQMHTVSSSFNQRRRRPPPPPPHTEFLIQGNTEIPHAAPPPPLDGEFSTSAIVSFLHLVVAGTLMYVTRAYWQPALRRQIGEENYLAITSAVVAARQRAKQAAGAGSARALELAGRGLTAGRVQFGRVLISLGKAATAGMADGETEGQNAAEAPPGVAPPKLAKTGAVRRGPKSVGPASSRQVKFGAIPINPVDPDEDGICRDANETQACDEDPSDHEQDEDADDVEETEEGEEEEEEEEEEEDEGVRFGGRRAPEHDEEEAWGEEGDETSEGEAEDVSSDEEGGASRTQALRFGGPLPDLERAAQAPKSRLHRVEKALAVLKGEDVEDEPPTWPGSRAPANAVALGLAAGAPSTSAARGKDANGHEPATKPKKNAQMATRKPGRAPAAVQPTPARTLD